MKKKRRKGEDLVWSRSLFRILLHSLFDPLEYSVDAEVGAPGKLAMSSTGNLMLLDAERWGLSQVKELCGIKK